MKRIIGVMVGLCLLLAFVSCGSSASSQQNVSGIHPWVTEHRRPVEGVLIGIGQYHFGSNRALQNQARTMAESRARAEIVRGMDTMVRQMIDDSTRSSEVDQSAVISYQAQVSQSLSQSRLQGAHVYAENIIDGSYYVVVHYGRSNVSNDVNQAQAAARLAVPIMSHIDLMNQMNTAFDAAAAQEAQIRDF